MATRKSGPATAAEQIVPSGATHVMLAKALFLESIQGQKLTPAAQQLRWKEESQVHLKRASRVAKQLERMGAGDGS